MRMMEQDGLVALLRSVEVFADLDAATLFCLSQQMHRVRFAAGDVLCREGETGDRLFLIHAGEVSVQKRGKQGDVAEVGRLGPNDVAGATSLVARGRRSATLTARSEVEAFVLDDATFRGLLREHPAIAEGVLTSLSRQLSRGDWVASRVLAKDLNRRPRIVFYDSKSYTEAAFRERNRYNYQLEFLEPRLGLETAALAQGADVVCPFVNDTIDGPVVRELASLGVRLIALRCAGYNHVDTRACQEQALPVVRVPAYSPHAIAEHAVALMLTLNRRLHRAHQRVREGNFALDGLVGFDMYEKTVGVVGTGQIGRRVCEILSGFGCRILAYDRVPSAEMVEKYKVTYVDLEGIWAASDIITLHAPLLPETRHMVDATAIERMKPGVMIINTSRGALIDTRALLGGLKSGRIGHAGLDVYEEEGGTFFEDFSDRVLTDDVLARLTTFHNVLVTAHQGFLTREALTAIADATYQSVRELELGTPPDQLTYRVSAAAG